MDDDLTKNYLNLAAEIVINAVEQWKEMITKIEKRSIELKTYEALKDEAKDNYKYIYNYYKCKSEGKRPLSFYPEYVIALNKYRSEFAKYKSAMEFFKSLKDLKRFFKSNWFEMICECLNFDPEYIKEKIGYYEYADKY